jgi:group I intron endonuclease
MELIHYVYITTNIINGKQYVGDRSCLCDPNEDKYLGSGRPYFKNALREYGKENFKKKILELLPTRIDAFNAQEKYIQKYNTLVPNGYNISPKGGHNVINSMSKETRNKISVKKKELFKDKMKHPMFHKGYLISGENNGMYGKNHSSDSIQKIKNSKKNISEETKKKLRGPKSMECRKNMSKSAKGRISPRKGVTLSKEIRDKISKGLRLRNHKY